MVKVRQDLTGMVFGRLTVLGQHVGQQKVVDVYNMRRKYKMVLKQKI